MLNLMDNLLNYLQTAVDATLDLMVCSKKSAVGHNQMTLFTINQFV